MTASQPAKPEGIQRIATGTIGALIRDFKAAPDWTRRGNSAVKQYTIAFARLQSFAHLPIESIERHHVLRLRDKYADTPAAADKLVSNIRALYDFAIDRGYGVTVNPADKVKPINKSESHLRWSDDECERFEASRPARQLMTAYMIGRYTGQRGGDMQRMGPRALEAGGIALTQEKTNKPIWIPLHDRLKAYLLTLPQDHPTYIVNRFGRQYTDTGSLSALMRGHLRSIGLSHLTLHGLRHTAAQHLAECGCTTYEIMAITGHTSASSVEIYLTTAEQRKRATNAMKKVQRKR